MGRVESFTHHLVKTLSASEKSYIKKQVKGNKLHLVELLDDLYKTEVCSNKEFAKQFRSRKYAKNLTQNKNYLRRKIIDTLVIYQCNRSPEINKRHQLNTIDVLIEKGFFDKTKPLIDGLLNECKKYEAFTTGYDLAVKARRIHNNNISSSLSKEIIKHYADERRFFLDQLSKVEQMATLNDIHITQITESEKIKAITKQLKLLNLEVEVLPDDYPYNAKRIFYYTKSELAKLKNEQEKRIFYLGKLVQLYENYPQFIERGYTHYLVDCINYLNSLINNLEYDRFSNEHKKIMTQLEVLEKANHVSENSRLYVLKYLFPQNAFNDSGDFGGALTFAQSYLLFLKKKKRKLTKRFAEVSSIQIALAFLYNEIYDNALDIIEPHLKSKNYINQYAIRVIQIICHYYLKNEFLMDHLFSSFIHYLKTNDKKEAITGVNRFKKYILRNELHKIKNDVLEDFTWVKWEFLKK